MGGRLSQVLETVRQPAYTGVNRCLPCTVVNVALAGLLALGVGVVLTAVTTAPIALAGGGLAFVVGLTTIWVRGYLVPGTPTLTKRYLPTRVLAYFEKGPAATPRDDGTVENEADAVVDVEAVLQSAGVVEASPAGDLTLTPAFERAWRDRIETLRDTTSLGAHGASIDQLAISEHLAAILEVRSERLRIETAGPAVVASPEGRRVGQWESRAALLADLAAAQLLETRLEDWGTRPVRSRSVVLNGLRIFLKECPACGGPVRMGEETVRSCCRERSVIAVSCESCEARLFETDAPV
ncbi:MAG: hypothetical protein ABEJ35_07440 [Halobacteriaceae archaeon]